MKTKSRYLTFWILCLTLAALASPARADVTLPFSGLATDGDGQPIEGLVMGKAVLCDENGDSVWSSDGMANNCTEPTDYFEFEAVNGFFAIKLGDAAIPGMPTIGDEVLVNSEELTLHFWFSADDDTDFELIARQKIATVPYSKSTEYWQNLLPEDVVRWDQQIPASQIGGVLSSSNLPIFPNNNRTLLIGDAAQAANVGIQANTDATNKPALRYNNAVGQWEFSNNGVAYSAIGSGGGGLGADPADCGANSFATAIDINGNLTCSAAADASVNDNITINSAAQNQRFTLGAANTFTIDAATTDHTGPQVMSMDVDFGNNNFLAALNMNVEVVDGVAGGNVYRGMNMQFTASDADADLSGIEMFFQDAPNAVAGSYVSGLTISNQDLTLGSMINGIQISGNVDTAFNASNSNITTALDIGDNSIRTVATTISSTELDLLDGLVVIGDITGVTAGAGLANGGATGAVTVDVGAGNGILANANDVALNLDYNPTWTNSHTHTLAAGERIIMSNTTSTLNNTGVVQIGLTDGAAAAGTIALDVLPDLSDDANAELHRGMRMQIASADTQDSLYGLELVHNSTVNTNDTTMITIDNASPAATSVIDTGIFMSALDNGGMLTAIDVSDNDINTALAIGSNNVTVGGATLQAGELALLDGATILGDITSVTAGLGLITGGTNGDVTVDVGAGTGIQVAANAVGIDQDASLNWTNTNNFDLTTGEYVGLSLSNTNDAIAGNIGTAWFTYTENANTDNDTGGAAIFMNGNGSTNVHNLVHVWSADNDNSVANGVYIRSNLGGMTDAIDVSDGNITNSINVGDNPIVGTTMLFNPSAKLQVNLPDNVPGAGTFTEGGNDYLTMTTSNGGEALTFGNALTNQAFRFAGSGAVIPITSDSNDLGSTSNEWKAIYLGDLGGLNLGRAQNVSFFYSVPSSRLNIEGPNANVWIEDKLISNTDPYTIADNGNGGTAAAFSLGPTTNYVELTCNDPQGCDVTMNEAGALRGMEVTVVNVGATALVILDVAGVAEVAAGSNNLGQYDAMKLVYTNDRWVQTSISNN